MEQNFSGDLYKPPNRAGRKFSKQPHRLKAKRNQNIRPAPGSDPIPNVHRLKTLWVGLQTGVVKLQRNPIFSKSDFSRNVIGEFFIHKSRLKIFMHKKNFSR
jgi:hypothetical protein